MGPQIFALVVFAGIIVLILFYRAKQREEEVRLREGREETARDQRLRAEQENLRAQMIAVARQSLEVFESMPNCLSRAEALLDQAEVDFSESAFAPFWDSIEGAAKTLGHFDEAVRRLNQKSVRYGELSAAYLGTPPAFPLTSFSVSRLGVSNNTAARMRAVVRSAQRNFQFATIYEQRKTNQILVAGFTSLANALDRMGSQIADSLENLSVAVGSMASVIEDSSRQANAQRGQILDQVGNMHEGLSAQATELVRQGEMALERLDNIQRGRKPPL